MNQALIVSGFTYQLPERYGSSAHRDADTVLTAITTTDDTTLRAIAAHSWYDHREDTDPGTIRDGLILGLTTYLNITMGEEPSAHFEIPGSGGNRYFAVTGGTTDGGSPYYGYDEMVMLLENLDRLGLPASVLGFHGFGINTG